MTCEKVSLLHLIEPAKKFPMIFTDPAALIHDRKGEKPIVLKEHNILKSFTGKHFSKTEAIFFPI